MAKKEVEPVSLKVSTNLKESAELVIACFRGPDGGSTANREDALDALEVALGRDPQDHTREFAEVVRTD